MKMNNSSNIPLLWELESSDSEKVTSAVIEKTIKHIAATYIINNTSTVFIKARPLSFEI